MDSKDLKIKPEQRGTVPYADALMFVRGWFVPSLSRRRRRARRPSVEQWTFITLCGAVSVIAYILTYLLSA